MNKQFKPFMVHIVNENILLTLIELELNATK